MDRSEPALIPEWLKSGGSVISGGYGNHQSASCLHSDDHLVSKHARNKSSVNSSESVHSDRTTSSYFRRSTSSKDSSHLRSYSSFNRNHRDRVWEDFPEFSDKDKFNLTEHKHHEYSDHLGGALSGKFSKENLRRSQSMVSRKKLTRDSSEAIKSSPINNSSLLLASGSVQSSMQTAFGRDFPSLGTEPKLGASELRRVPSPVLGPASVTVGGVDGWTSSLAEVPGLIASSSTSSLLSQQAASGSSSPLSQRTGGLNMAEAVAQGPSRARTPPQASLDTQRLEELAIKQSRQLIPVIPSTTKSAALSPLEKLKPKSGQQQSQVLPLNHGIQSLRSGPAKLDPGKATNLGKLQVLKPSREMLNGIPSINKETVSPKNGVKAVHSPLSHTPSTTAISAPNKSPVKNQLLSVPEQKAGTLLTNLEKKPSQQVQSRMDFFNLLKKKSSATNPPGGAGSGIDSSVSEKSNGEASSLSKRDALGSSVKNGGKVMNNGQVSKKNHLFVENGVEEHLDLAIPDPDEEEAAFLRLLGWDESAGEEGLTEEEIKAFYELVKLRPPPSQA